MTAKWKNGFDPDVILGKLSNIRTLDEEKVSFRGFEYEDYISVLKSMIDIAGDFPVEVAHGFIIRGFYEAAKKQALTSSSVISAVTKEVLKHLDKPNEHYCLVTTINISHRSDLPRYKINGCSLQFHKRLPKKFINARQAFLATASRWQIDNDDSASHYVVASMSGKSPYDVVAKMLDAIDLVRGIWNLYVNKRIVMRFGGRREPVNQVVLGPLHTLHNKHGDKISDLFWYESDHCTKYKTVDLSKKYDGILELTKTVRKALNKNNYKQETEVALIRYVRALDSQDYNSAFIKLWGVLEYLTHTLKDGYDKTIRRAAFLYTDNKYQRQVLEHLRQYRNKSVHLGAGDYEIDTCIYQLKNYIEQLLQFHIANHFKFDSLKDAAEFMDLQPNIETLKKKIALCQAGIKFMGG